MLPADPHILVKMAVRRVPSFSSRPGFPAGLRVLLLDCTANREACAAQLTQCNYEVTSCSSIGEALVAMSTAKASNTPFDVVLGEASALTAKSHEGSQLRAELKDLPTIVMCESPKPEEVMLTIKLGFAELLERPLCPLKLKNIWQHAARRMMVRSPSSPVLKRADTHHQSAEAQRQASSNLGTFNEIASKSQLYSLQPSSDNASPALGKQVGSLAHASDTAPLESEECRRPHKRRSRELSRSSTASQLPQQHAEGAGRRTSAELTTPHTGQSASGHSSSTNPSPCTGEPTAPTAMPMGCMDAAANTACSLPALASGCPPMQAWPLPTPPGCLPLGMVWGVPLNPMAVAPGITPPIFPPANPAMMPLPAQSWPLFPQSGMPGMPAPGMFHPLMPGLPMPCGAPFMPPAALPGQLPPLPMSMLMSACGGPGMNMCGMAEGMDMASLSQQHMQQRQDMPCSPTPTDPSLETLSDKSGQDVLNLGLGDITFSNVPQSKMPRCESNALLPSLEDLIADNNDNDMELELEALSLGCLGMGSSNASQHTAHSMHHGTSGITASSAMMQFRRNDSLDDLINGPSVLAF